MEAIILSETIVNVLKNRQQDDPERPQIDRRSVERRSHGSGLGPSAGNCQHYNELCCCIKRDEFLDQMSDCQFQELYKQSRRIFSKTNIEVSLSEQE